MLQRTMIKLALQVFLQFACIGISVRNIGGQTMPHNGLESRRHMRVCYAATAPDVDAVPASAQRFAEIHRTGRGKVGSR